MFKDIEEKELRGEFAVKSDSRETPIHVTTLEDIYALLEDGYKVDDDRIPDPKNKPIPTGDTDLPIYK